jgi:hypothetical protein
MDVLEGTKEVEDCLSYLVGVCIPYPAGEFVLDGAVAGEVAGSGQQLIRIGYVCSYGIINYVDIDRG